MKSGMGLSHWRQSERLQEVTGPNASAPPLILAPKTALGSHPCVALSSAQAEYIITQVTACKGYV
jgi:hypothetical protein